MHAPTFKCRGQGLSCQGWVLDLQKSARGLLIDLFVSDPHLGNAWGAKVGGPGWDLYGGRGQAWQQVAGNLAISSDICLGAS